MHLWRISNYADLKGYGGLKYDARWHNKGRPIVYCAEHPAGALSEMLAHMDRSMVPDTYMLLKIMAPDEIQPISAKISFDKLTENVATTRQIGDRWLAAGKSLLLRVPSAIVPDAYNVLINPLHPDAAKLKIVKRQHVPFDKRLG
jgi:RES domain-containing protein